MASEKIIQMQFHPRAFAAFGADLVTNDTVALTELVKNSYDAFAYNVDVEFAEDNRGKYIQISDDGIGMTSDIIEDSWAVIATPYKYKNPIVERNGKLRYVSGNKGLGRFSAARLGSTLHMWTKSGVDSFIHVQMDWRSFLEYSNIDDCQIRLENLPAERSVFAESGTIIRIRNLHSEWSEEKVCELRDNLSRLISPFKQADSFSINLISPFFGGKVEIKPSTLIENPVYKLSGSMDDVGVISWQYNFNPPNNTQKNCIKHGIIEWDEARKGFNQNLIFGEEYASQYKAGAFSFEIRVWDLDSDSMEDLEDTFDLKKRAIRNIISQYKGLSVYRDGVLVLPKSNASKDWLGIDLRRVSALGRRLSTNQMVGAIYITSENNQGIRDATDREKLVDTPEYTQFVKAVESIVGKLQNLRNAEKHDNSQAGKPGLSNLIAPLSAQSLVQQIEHAVERGDKYEDILEYVRDYSNETEKGINTLQNRLTYYAQTASLGSVAIVLLHEILTGMTVIKRFFRRVYKKYSPFDETMKTDYDDADRSHARILEVTKSFAPLYRRGMRKEKNLCDLKEALDSSIRLIQSQKSSKGIDIRNRLPAHIQVSMHSGELQTIFVNLLDNACYWLQTIKAYKEIDIACEIVSGGNRAKITISDNGPGISEDEAQLIFDAGITSKPYGIGMGLVIVTEILNYYGGSIATLIPGTIGGATFLIDIPIL